MATKTPAKKLDKELNSVLRIVQAGGCYSKAEIAAFNEEYSQQCDYCGCEVCDSEHIIWHCTYFSEIRCQHNSVLASIPPRDINAAVMRGVAPAMRRRPGATVWGQAIAAAGSRDRLKDLMQEDTKLARRAWSTAVKKHCTSK